MVDRWWIGGSPCSGKSTVAGMLAASWQLPLYRCDDAFARHAAVVEPAAGPTLKKVTAMPIGDRLAQPIEVQVGDVVRGYREEFPLIVQDLAGAGPILVEGAALLPDLLAGLDVPRNRAVWMVPAEDFQRHHYRRRQWAHDLLASLVDADGAFDRWMRRDAVFARLVAEQARRLGYPVVSVDGTAEPADVAASVEDLLDLSRT
jgi:2-phosphoglycerate kinase